MLQVKAYKHKFFAKSHTQITTSKDCDIRTQVKNQTVKNFVNILRFFLKYHTFQTFHKIEIFCNTFHNIYNCITLAFTETTSVVVSNIDQELLLQQSVR